VSDFPKIYEYFFLNNFVFTFKRLMGGFFFFKFFSPSRRKRLTVERFEKDT